MKTSPVVRVTTSSGAIVDIEKIGDDNYLVTLEAGGEVQMALPARSHNGALYALTSLLRLQLKNEGVNHLFER